MNAHESQARAVSAAPPRFVVLIPGLRTVSESNRSRHEHWAVTKKRVDEQHRIVDLHLRARSLRCPFPFPIDVTLTRISPGRLDSFENLPNALKHVADAVAWWAIGYVGKIGQADRDENRIRFTARQEKQGRGVYGVRIEVAPRVP